MVRLRPNLRLRTKTRAQQEPFLSLAVPYSSLLKQPVKESRLLTYLSKNVYCRLGRSHSYSPFTKVSCLHSTLGIIASTFSCHSVPPSRWAFECFLVLFCRLVLHFAMIEFSGSCGSFKHRNSGTASAPCGSVHSENSARSHFYTQSQLFIQMAIRGPIETLSRLSLCLDYVWHRVHSVAYTR